MGGKVSILIPCYNAEAYIAETIRSAINQSWKNKEIIVVNDGSTDQSGEIAESFRSENVKIFHEPNAGACKARNTAFERCSGDYIQYLDADDLLSEEKIEKQMLLLAKEPSGTAASSAWRRFFGAPDNSSCPGSPIYKDYTQPVEMLLDMWSYGYTMQTSVWLVPRSTIEKAGKWNEDLSINQDGEYFCRILLNSPKVKFSPEGMVYYRAGVSGSVSQVQGQRKKVESLLKSFQLYEKQIFQIEDSARVKNGLARNYYSFIYEYYHLYPDLSKEAMNKVNSWGIPPVQIGGKNFKKIAGLLGFYTTLRLRKFFRHKSSTLKMLV